MQMDAQKLATVSYLDADSHWQAIVRGLFRHNLSGQSIECDLHDYCVGLHYMRTEKATESLWEM